jgi:hypothetical protein
MKPSLLFLALFALLPRQAHSESKPNIVYFLIDDAGYADCGFNGGKDIRTPNIDKLAKAGAVLTSFYVQPVCSPTRAALMTGRYATHTGVYGIVGPGAPWGLPLAERLLPEALKGPAIQPPSPASGTSASSNPNTPPLAAASITSMGTFLGCWIISSTPATGRRIGIATTNL